MSERMARGHGVEVGHAATAASSSVEPQRPAPTQRELAYEAAVALEREIVVLRGAIANVREARAANDPERWAEARANLDRAVRAAARTRDRARAREGAAPDVAGRIASAERAIDELAATPGMTEPPAGFAPVSREAEITAILSAPIEGTVAVGYEQKERALRAELDQLSAAESRVLAQRVRRARPNDPLAAQFHRMTAERRERLLAYLDGARRRDALRGARAPKPLPDAIRSDLETSTGTSLAHVRVHDDDRGQSVAAAHGARAVTIGSDIYMGEGQPDASSADGRELLAHEVAHVVQTQACSHPGAADAPAGGDTDAAEVEADTFAATFRQAGAAVSWRPSVRVERTTPLHKKGSNVLRPPPSSKPASRPFLVPDADHPAVKDSDGEQLIQTDKSTVPSKPAALRDKKSKALATVAETVTVTDDAGDSLKLEITYRLEERPAEIGEIPDIWIHTERRAMLTLGTGEHAGATITGAARVRIGPDEVLDPKAAISRPSIGPGHMAQVYLEASQQFVHVYGHDGRRSLHADAVDNDVLVYDDPLRTMMGLKRILKQQHIAGQGEAVARLHRQVPQLLQAAKVATTILDGHIKAVKSHHDGDGRLPQVRWVLGDIANWLAANHLQGRGDSEQAEQLRSVHRRLLELYDTAKAAKAPERDLLDDVLMMPFRFVERTGEGIKEVGAMAVDAVALGVVAAGRKAGKDWSWDPISKYGDWVNETGASSTDGLVAIVNGFADQWSDAIERARNGDYSGVMDAGLDTVLMVDGVRTTSTTAITKGAHVVAKVRDLSKRARAVAGRVPAEVRDIVTAMADAADAFAAKQRAAGMQMAGGPDIPSGPTADSIVAGLAAAKETFRNKRLAQRKDQSIATLKRRLGRTHAPDIAEWLTRVEAVFGGDTKAFTKFLDGIGQRLIAPAPFMRQVEVLLASRSLGADDVVTALRSIFDGHVLDPTAVLGEIHWLTTRTLSAETRSMLIRRAAKGEVDISWLQRTKLTDTELELMGQDTYTSWKEFELASDLRSRRGDTATAEHRANATRNANTKARGIAGELVAAEHELPDGLRVRRRVVSNNSEPSNDFELVTRDGAAAEMEVKAHDANSWKQNLDEYDRWKQDPASMKREQDPPSMKREPQIVRLIRQIGSGRSKGRQVYLAVTDGMSMRSRARLADILEPEGVPKSHLIYLPEAEIQRLAKQLREHMGIQQPKFGPKKPKQ